MDTYSFMRNSGYIFSMLLLIWATIQLPSILESWRKGEPFAEFETPIYEDYIIGKIVEVEYLTERQLLFFTISFTRITFDDGRIYIFEKWLTPIQVGKTTKFIFESRNPDKFDYTNIDRMEVLD